MTRIKPWLYMAAMFVGIIFMVQTIMYVQDTHLADNYADAEDIYTEEIEDQLNSMPYVSESLIVHRDGKLVALIHPDYDTAFKEEKTVQDVAAQMEENRKELNKNMPAYSQVASVQIHSDEFEKTPKKSIKRYLYQ
jgi:long-chain acyl-CoA synthetase